MVLRKRKRDGEFVTWAPASGHSAAASFVPDLAQPPRKKAHAKHVEVSEPYIVSDIVQKTLETSIPAYSPNPTAQAVPKMTQASASSSTSVKGPNSRSQSTKQPKSHMKTDTDAPEQEKRLAKFKKSCPKTILERVERVMTQRFFMIDRKRTSDTLEEVFSVLGSTGNVYTVTIDHKPSCDCPDAMKGNHCKHILFVFLKVLQVPQTSGFWYQKLVFSVIDDIPMLILPTRALLTSELEAIFADAPLAPNALAPSTVREAHAQATGKSVNPVEPQPSTKRRIPGPEDDCPICYEGMHNIKETSLIFCEDCGNALHTECFQQWRASTLRGYRELTCVWCRAKWVHASPVASGSNSGARTSSGGYLNLGSVSGVSPVRDTSTYYHGPRRGQRYSGYQDYYD